MRAGVPSKEAGRRALRLALVSIGVVIVCAWAGGGLIGLASAASAPNCGSVTYTTNSSGWYEVDSVDKLQCIDENHGSASSRSDALSSDYVLTSDIDASGTSSWNTRSSFTETFTVASSPKEVTVGFTPIDGNSVTVTDTTDDSSLSFTVVDASTGTIEITERPLGDAEVSYNTQSPKTVGFDPIGDSGTKFTGTFDGTGHTISDLTISRTGMEHIGLFGFVGSGGTVTNSSVESISSTGNDKVGALVGRNEGTVSGSHASGEVDGNEWVGGLVGWNHETITESSATTDVEGTSSVGGLVGTHREGTISVSYATGTVTGDDFVGGLVGDTMADISSSYAAGNTSGSSSTGGLVGGSFFDPTIASSYWDTEQTSQASSDGGTGLTTEQMQGSSASSNMSGLDFAGMWETVENGDSDTIADGYPVLQSVDRKAQLVAQNVWTYASGDGSASTPYEITTWHHLDNVRQNLDSTFVLAADLDSNTAGYGSIASSSANSNNGFDSIGDFGSKFTGTFDGANHTISGLYMDRSGTEYMGAFGWVGSGGTIENVGVINADITAGEFVGALVGRNEGTVKRSNSSGTVHVVGGGGHVKRKAGGLVGVNGGTITNSNSSADATSDNTYAGGLVGDNFGTITKSYATGNATASGDIAGGLVGSNDGTITHSYATGDVSADSDTGGLAGRNIGSLKYSYWDNGTTNQGSAVGSSFMGGSTTDVTGFGSKGDSSPASAMQRFAPQVNMDTLDYSSTWKVTSGYPALQWEGVAALTVDSVDATDPTVSEDASGSITVTAKEGGTDAGEGVTIEVLDDDGLDGFATSDTKTTDANGEVTFTFDEPTDGTYSPEFAWAEDTSVSHTPTVTVQNAPEVSSIVRKSGESNPTNADQVTFTVTFTESVSGVDSSDFTITDTAGGTASIASVTEEDANNDGDDVWEVQLGSLSGDGDVRLDLDDDDSITSDSTSVKLGGVGTSGGTGDGSYSSGERFTVDNTAVALDSVAKSDTTTIDVELSDGGGGIDKSSISKDDFSLSTGSIASIDKTGVTDGGTGTQTVSLSLAAAVDTDTVTVSLQSDGIDDTAGNTQTSGSADATGMDGVAPTLDAASKVDSTTIDVDLSDGGTGIDKSSITKADFSTSAGSIASIDTSSVTDSGTGTQTVTISLASAVDTDTVTVSLQSDGIDDTAGNTQTSGSADATGMDGVAPTLDDATKADDTTINVDLSDGGAGIDKSTISSGDFSLSTGSIASIDKTGVTDGGTGTQTVTISLNSPVDTDTVTVSLQSDGVDDIASNTRTSGSADATGMDGVAPTLDAATKSDDITIDVDLSEGGTGIDKSSISKGDFSTSAGSIASIDTSSVTDGGTGTQPVTISLASAVDAATVTVSLQSDGIADTAGNTQTSGSVDATGMDGVAPTLVTATKVDTTTIDVDLSEGGTGIDTSSIAKSDFSTSAGSISAIDTSSVTDGGTGTQTVTISLASPVDADTVTVSLQSDGIDDLAGNTQTSGSAAVAAMDGVAPSFDTVTKVDDTTIDVELSDSGAGIDKSTISSGDFSLSTGSIASIDTGGVTDGGTGTQTVTLTLAAAVDTDTVTVSLQSDGIDDLAGNTVTAGAADASNMDGVAPSITDSTIASDNSYVDVTFSEGVYESDGGSALTAAALSATSTRNGGTVSSASVSSVTKIDGTSLAGGETTVRVHLSLSGGPADGVETVQIGPADDSSVGDDDTNLVASAETTSSITLADRSGPTLTADTGSTDEDTSAELVADLLSNDNDASTPLSVTQVDGSAGTVGTATDGSNGGEFTITSDGTVDFDPSGEFDSLGGGDTDTTQVSVTVADAVGNTNTQTVTATVQGVNDAPTDITLTSTAVAQSAGTDAVVGSLSASDVDDSSHTVSLVSGTGDTDNGAFSIDGSDLVADDAATLAEGTDSVRLAAADGTGGTDQDAFSISVTDDVAPTITATKPADDATGVLESSNITITFSEDIAFGTGEITLRESDGGFSDRDTFDVGSDTGSGNGTVSISGSTLRIDPSTELAGMTTYAVQIDAGALTDTATSPNDFAGIVDDTTLSFTTADVTPPTATVGSEMTVDEGESVQFDASASADDVGIVSYEWDFDDGTTATGETTSHEFATAGAYEVELTVTDAAGNDATAVRTITVEDSNAGGGIDLEPVPEAGDEDGTSPNESDSPNAGESEGVSSTPSDDRSMNFSVSDPDGEGPIVIDIDAPESNETRTPPEGESSPEEATGLPTTDSGETVDRGGGGGASKQDNVTVDGLTITPTETGQREFDLSVREWEADATTVHGTDTDSAGNEQQAGPTSAGQGQSTQSRTDPRAFLQATGASPIGYVEVAHTNPDTDIESVTFQFRIQKAHLQETGVGPEAVSLYRNESDRWARLSTEQVAETDTHHIFEATSPGLSLFTIGSIQPAFEVAAAYSQQNTVAVSERITVDATVRNIGGAAGSYTVELRANGTIVATTSVDLAPTATQAISLSFNPTTPGNYTLTVGSVRAGTVSVQSDASHTQSAPIAAKQLGTLGVTAVLCTVLALFVLGWRRL